MRALPYLNLPREILMNIARSGLVTAARVGIAGALLIALHNLVLAPLTGQPWSALMIVLATIGTALLFDRLGMYGPRRKLGMRGSHRRPRGSDRKKA